MNSTSARPQAHPVVHTHQGNFPRLYATLLYALGMKSVTSQVLATVLPVGFASVLLLYAALFRFVGFGIACTAMLVMLTDYILFVQWQVVTYRVWHFAFTSALLAIAVFYRPAWPPMAAGRAVRNVALLVLLRARVCDVPVRGYCNLRADNLA